MAIPIIDINLYNHITTLQLVHYIYSFFIQTKWVLVIYLLLTHIVLFIHNTTTWNAVFIWWLYLNKWLHLKRKSSEYRCYVFFFFTILMSYVFFVLPFCRQCLFPNVLYRKYGIPPHSITEFNVHLFFTSCMLSSVGLQKWVRPR